MIFLRVLAAMVSVSEHHDTVGGDHGVHQLSEPRNAKPWCEIVIVEPAPTRLVIVENAASLRGGDARHHVEFVLLGEGGPTLGHVAIILRRYTEPRGIQ